MKRNKTKLPKFFHNNYKFYTNEKKGIVLVKLEDINVLFTDALREYLTKYNKSLNVSFYECEAIVDKVLNDRTCLIGIAKCSDEDVFDVEVGKKIAIKKLQAKIIRCWDRIFDELFIFYQNKLEKVVNYKCKRHFFEYHRKFN